MVQVLWYVAILFNLLTLHTILVYFLWCFQMKFASYIKTTTSNNSVLSVIWSYSVTTSRTRTSTRPWVYLLSTGRSCYSSESDTTKESEKSHRENSESDNEEETTVTKAIFRITKQAFHLEIWTPSGIIINSNSSFFLHLFLRSWMQCLLSFFENWKQQQPYFLSLSWSCICWIVLDHSKMWQF